ncbi:MAG TPA: hypothetical protein EYO58_11620 [Flavobacteriales bacterium]|nr:hypothetical protein [Flavobacteriales bacterium]
MRRELAIVEGERYSETALQMSRAAICQLGFF